MTNWQRKKKMLQWSNQCKSRLPVHLACLVGCPLSQLSSVLWTRPMGWCAEKKNVIQPFFLSYISSNLSFFHFFCIFDSVSLLTSCVFYSSFFHLWYLLLCHCSSFCVFYSVIPSLAVSFSLSLLNFLCLLLHHSFT